MCVKTLELQFRDWEAHVFGYGYGTGEEYILWDLKCFFGAIPPDGSYDHEDLEEACGPAVAWLLINTLCRADIIDYGTSPRYGFLTERGHALKRFVDSRTVDDLVEIAAGDKSLPEISNCTPQYCNCDRECQNAFWVNLPGRKNAV